jgi:Tfp pilus assembly protein PilE
LSRRNRLDAGGFTLAELMVIIVLTGILSVTIYSIINSSFSNYISLEKEGSAFSDLASQSQRVSNVLRGTTDINSATANDIDCYAYFAPSDAYVSRIHYYKSGGKLLADVTRMSSNPPIGTPIAASLKTFTIIPVFSQQAGVNTFTYLDAGGSALTLPIQDLKTIKGIQVTLVVPGGNSAKNTTQTLKLQVSLRNRKVNL